MTMQVLSAAMLDKIAGGLDLTLPPGFRDPGLPITPCPPPLPRPWPPRYGVDPIPAPPGLRPVEI